MKRQGAKLKGLKKRLMDMKFEKVDDPRVEGKVTYKLSNMLIAMVVSVVTHARSLRQVETRTGQISKKNRKWLGIEKRIADNTFSKVLHRLSLPELTPCLHRLIKTEHRRGNLKPVNLPWGTVAIDGKNVATLKWHDLCRLVGVDEDTEPKRVKWFFGKQYPEAQVCIPENGKPYALMRVHTVTLISSGAPVCIHLRSIAGDTNEIGSMKALLGELKENYGRTNLFSMVTTDAGNISVDVAAEIRKHKLHYFAQIKTNHGEIYIEALSRLQHRDESKADDKYVDVLNGKIATYYAWRTDLTYSGWLDWDHARQIVRVKRSVMDPVTGEITEGNRYYVSSKFVDELSPKAALKFSRRHWTCENSTHWTADAEFMEDRVRHAWSRHPKGILAVSLLRIAAIAILSIARYFCRFEYTKEKPTWAQIKEHYLLTLCASSLLTEDFDAI